MADPVIPPTPDAAWHAGLDDATKAYVQTKGLADKPVIEAFASAAKFHREAEAFVGTPAERLLRLPAEANDAEGWKAVWQKLGAPVDAAGYDFSGIKRAGDQPVEAALTEALRTAALNANLPVSAAQGVATAVVQALDAQAVAQATERAAALETARAALKANWGQNYEAFQFAAKQAATALGVTPEQVTALESVVGYDKVMDMFRNIAGKIGEDRFINNGPNKDAPMTVEAAKERLDELKRDQAWAKRFLDGDSAANKEFQALTTIAYGAA